MKKMLLTLAVICCFQLPGITQIDTSSIVYSWKLDNYYVNHIRNDVDTLLDNFQNHNPLFRNYISASTLGNYGQPAVSNIFTERNHDQEFLLINTFYPFMKFPENTSYFNTRKPFTQITYIKGGSSRNKEEILDAFHTQNLTKTLNVGLHYTTVGSLGQYKFQKVKNNSFNFFSSHSGTLYNYHLSVNLNKIVADENGGVISDALITDTTFSVTKDIPTLFGGTDNPPRHVPDVYNEIRNLNIFTIQELSFRNKRGKSDSAARKIRIFYPKLVYIFHLNRFVRLFKDVNPSVGLDNGLYPALLINENATSDSLYYWRLFNGVRLHFQGKKNNHYFVDYSYEMLQYTMAIPTAASQNDTLENHWFITDEIRLPGISYNSRLFNSYISSGFDRIFANHVELNAYGRYFLTGYRAGDFLLAGELKLFTGKSGQPNSILLRGSNELKSPDFLYTHFASNNFIWTKNFNRTLWNNLSANITLSSLNVEIQGDYYLIGDFIYFNKEAVPEQYHTGLSVLALSAAKRFDFWKVSSTSRIAYQKTDNESVLGLPAISFYNSTSLKHQINFRATGGKLLTMIGFDLFYNSKYYADAYMPPLASFYRQQEKHLGNYPYVDVFLNVQLKRLRFFLKMEHVNSGWIDKNYFSILHYPRNERSIKFGLSWTFYD
ncbi:MAG TPA: putative porin [Bacteroidales bacterium]|nr:putative porin [Bacteroidales bacterium]